MRQLISRININNLFEDFSLLASRRFYDDPRSKVPISVIESNLGILGSSQLYDEMRARLNGSEVSNEGKGGANRCEGCLFFFEKPGTLLPKDG
jgi:hypothetical protein